MSAVVSLSSRWLKAAFLSAVLLVAAGFVYIDPLHFYLHYNEAAYTDLDFGGAANYWRMRGWLLMHIISGTLALLLGPFQFSRRLRQRHLLLHRVAGRIYVAAVLSACAAALNLAANTVQGKGFGFALTCMSLVWASATVMAFYAALRRRILVHNQWMIRSYVVTFGFVSFRAITMAMPATWLPVNEASDTAVWMAWSIPLFVTELILQIKHVNSNH